MSCNQLLTKYYTFQFINLAGAVVGLEQTSMSVSEDVGVVELCAVVLFPRISCPISFPFEVRLSTAAGTAGKKSSFLRLFIETALLIITLFL